MSSTNEVSFRTNTQERFYDIPVLKLDGVMVVCKSTELEIKDLIPVWWKFSFQNDHLMSCILIT